MQLLDRIHFLLYKHMNGKQKELADALGVSEAAISKLLNGVKNIETETIFKLEEVFGEPIITVVEEVRTKRYGKKV
ncbi:MAG: helix-turn-helix domain-containing protein [Sediminibacterium sp.]|nr:helix-turn-helix domain-containing protein [Sediminibacterium sp.]